MNIKKGYKGASGKAPALGVTGGVGSGKSIVCKRLAELGVPVFSADQLARRAVQQGTAAYERIVEHFGEGILAPDGSIDRPKLRGIIIEDDFARKTLEDFIHPGVLRRIEENIKQERDRGASMVAVEVPLLFETEMQSFFDYVVMVSAARETRIKRVMDRDRTSREQAESLMKTQMPDSEKRRLADYVIDNNKSLADVYAEVDRIYEKLRS
ncbi:MAG: dephospho-CoA kinase [Thermodesulfobacteriota bacterium]